MGSLYFGDNLFVELKDLLKKDSRLVVEGELLKNQVTEFALKLDKDLLKLLLSAKRIKEHFFADVDDVLVFDKEKFTRFVNNKEFLPDSYTSFKNKIGLTVGENYLSENKEVVLSWAYKDAVLEGGQAKEDATRDEIFWNEILAPDDINRLLSPKVFTNWKHYGKKKKNNQVSLLDDNLILKGNNLLALHSLKKRFAGSVKLIYIDPPYNTGAEGDTFAYNNAFKHSTWLTFMKNRLEVARDLITPDGFIAIAIDHVELFYLGTIADEIFGRENRVGLVTVLHNPKGRNLAKFFSSNSEFMLVYAKDIDIAEFNDVAISDDVKESFNNKDEDGRFRYVPFMRARTVWSRANKPNNWYPIYVSKDLKDITADKKSGYYEVFPITNNGKEMAWKNIRQSFIDLNKDDYFMAEIENGKIIISHKLREQQVYKSVWTDKKYQSEFHGTNLLKKLLGPNKFSYPKSLYLVVDVLKIMTSEDDIILDFFGGSGTTAHAVLELNKEDGGNRRFILCEQMDYIENVTIERIQKVIDGNEQGSFTYCQLFEWNENFVKRIYKAKKKEDLKALWHEMQSKAHLSYKVDLTQFKESAKEFDELNLEEQKRFLIEILDKNALYVNLSEMDDKTYDVSEEDKRLNRQFYGL